MIINPKKKPAKSREQRNQEWLSKVTLRIEKRKAKEATRKRPKAKVEYSVDDLSPELRAKLGLDAIDTNTTEPIPSPTDVDTPWNN